MKASLAAAGAAGVHFGFNASGPVNPAQQVQYAKALLEQFSPAQRAGLVIRVLGGTASQRATSSDWSDEAITGWVKLQSSTGVLFSFTVNGNDTPGSQRAFLDRWLSLGVRFQFIEMMNEYYLPKYANEDTSFPEVTRAVDANDYVSTILPAYIAAFRGAGLPIFVILAPARTTANSQARNDAWNGLLIDRIGSFGQERIGVTLHLYKDSDPFDYEQIDRIAARLPKGMPIAITESGIVDPAVVAGPAYGQAATEHLAAIHAKLRPGDYLFDLEIRS